ncbi:MAG TPA: imidazole glycerol phosphate synthase subunit HisH [Caulobacteraceae bacterium]|jgi:glutamine amidotransferase|nr:imidazole glycerol phosphate synthase subunit HisH [Caulobacteraceae bacterium]
MSATVALIDYGSGNLHSAEKALMRAAADLARPPTVATTDDPEIISTADAIVLPGVGAFSACRRALMERPGVVEAITDACIDRGAPFLGICVGMQLMATRGLEFGETPGLDWIAGDVVRLAPSEARFKIPHVGWNSLDFGPESPLFHGLPTGTDMYFTHSYALKVRGEGDASAWTDHGGRFAAAVAKDNLAGVQFHPEKSQAAGLRLLANFLAWRP